MYQSHVRNGRRRIENRLDKGRRLYFYPLNLPCKLSSALYNSTCRLFLRLNLHHETKVYTRAYAHVMLFSARLFTSIMLKPVKSLKIFYSAV